MSASSAYLEVAEIRQETEEVKSLIFDFPAALQNAFQYRAGQFLTLRLPTADGDVRRAYSISSSADIGEPLMVSVKRQPHGRGSGYIHDVLQVGDRLQVGRPKGRFCPNIRKENHRTYFLFAAGSGITPIFSILKTVLHMEPYSHVYLFYGSRNQPSIIFKQTLEALARKYPKRFRLIHILSKPLSRTWTALWKTVPKWDGLVGRIDEKQVRTWIEAYPPPAQDAHYLICGPGEMIGTIEKTLMSMDVPQDRIYTEHFGARKIRNPVEPVTRANLALRFNGESHELAVPIGETLLTAIKNVDLQVPFSCESGICGTCVAKLVSGEVTMQHCAALDETERNAGKILTCQAMAASPDITINIGE